MATLAEFFVYFAESLPEILIQTVIHLRLTVASILVAVSIGVPLGILVSYIKPLKKPVLGFANVVQALPSIALLGFLVPFLGIGEKPAICMVVVYSLLPIIKNTATGLSSVNPQTLEAARGIGMTKFQVLTRVKLPLSLPVMMAGIRISAVSAVGLVTLAAFIGADGLGFLIYAGIRTLNNFKIVSGAIPACILALAVDLIFAIIERAVTPAHLKERPKQ
jgi:osmoprotectant transport system permease protein